MKRGLKRDYTLTAAEVRDIIVAYLATRDIQVPKDMTGVACLMDPSGVTIAWADEDEIKVL